MRRISKESYRPIPEALLYDAISAVKQEQRSPISGRITRLTQRDLQVIAETLDWVKSGWQLWEGSGYRSGYRYGGESVVGQILGAPFNSTLRNSRLLAEIQYIREKTGQS